MTANPPTPPQAAQTGTQGVNVPVQHLLDRYAHELASMTQRALMAEAGLSAAEDELAALRNTTPTPDHSGEPTP